VRSAGEEVAVAEGGAGATGDGASLEDGGWSDIKSGRGAFVAMVAPVWARPAPIGWSVGIRGRGNDTAGDGDILTACLVSYGNTGS
jgi:hypothetical protein